MALRIRLDGTMVCAALSEPHPGDLYLPDELHYQLSITGLIVALPIDRHQTDPRWWWANAAHPEADRWAVGQTQEGQWLGTNSQ